MKTTSYHPLYKILSFHELQKVVSPTTNYTATIVVNTVNSLTEPVVAHVPERDESQFGLLLLLLLGDLVLS